MLTDIEKQFITISRSVFKTQHKRQHKLNRKKLKKIFNASANVYCHWCKKEVFRNKQSKCSDNSATIDHIYELYDIRRNLLSEDENTVCACYRCNMDRAKKESKNRNNVTIFCNK